MSLAGYHNSERERSRVASLLSLLPDGVDSVLDIGARDGHITRLLAQRVAHVTALDLTRPEIDDPRITCVQADATELPYADRQFDLVFCAEVLEHIPEPQLSAACREMARVAGRHLIVGVPYRQDIRLWRTTCAACGATNPPWGHVNSFDEARLAQLFPGLPVAAAERIGTAEPDTNALSAWLMERARHPYGTYSQQESCVHCGAAPSPAPLPTVAQRVLSRLALAVRDVQSRFQPVHANWIHLLLTKA